jgi:predicted protein tyrosine phosphatase
MEKILFVCSMAISRSFTAANIFKKKYTTDYAGLNKSTKRPVNISRMNWADKIVVMEYWMDDELKRRFPEINKPIYCLSIPNRYEPNEENLIQLLLEEVPCHLDK